MVESTVWFGAGGSVFGIGVVLFVWFAVRRGDLSSPFYYIPPVLTLVAGVAYGVMTGLSVGALPQVVSVETVRFADWMVSTPLISYYLGLLAGAERSTRWVAVGTNVAMIATGYAFVALSGPLRWVGFVASMALFAGLLYLFVRTFRQALVGASQTSRSLFVSLRDLTVTTWLLYPVAYFLGPVGVGVVTAGDLDFVVATLDVTAKVGLMAIILLRQYELNTFLSRDAPAAG